MNDILRMLATDSGVNQDFAKQFDAVPRSQFEWAKGRTAKLEKAITEYLDAYWNDSGEQDARQRLRELVDWTEDECYARANEGALPDDHSAGNRQ